jgi:hypothetical protein
LSSIRESHKQSANEHQSLEEIEDEFLKRQA